ncbi:MAG: ABC transporter permease [Bryobacteraceae bacterium]|nr:ABC transporter permease [Bryobacteraceae bacterium]
MRSLLRKPGYTLLAVLTLAIGIGMCATVFSLVKAVILRPLSYANSGAVVTLLYDGQRPVSPADFQDWKREARSYQAMEAAFVWGAVLTGSEAAEQVTGLQMTPGMFRLLGDKAALGRTLQAQDASPGFAAKNVVLGDSLWKRRFGADPRIAGRTVRLSGEVYTVVGVMAPDFRFPPFWATSAEMWVPLDMTSMPKSRQARMLRVFGLLKDNVPLQAAQAEMNTIGARLAAVYPDSNTGLVASVDPLADRVSGKARTPLLLLFGAVGLLLLVACANVAGLMLARAVERRREIGVRLALGASAKQIAMQMLGESLLVGLAGGLLGVVLAVVAVEVIAPALAVSPADLSRLEGVHADASILAFCALTSLLTGVLFGMVPAWQAARVDLNDSLRDGSRGASEGRSGLRLRSLLVSAQTAICIVLLAGAGALLQSYRQMRALDPGFASENLLTMTISLAGRKDYVGERRDALYAEVTSAIRDLPGVLSASMVNHLPVGGDTWGTRIAAEGAPARRPGEEHSAVFRISQPDYLATLNIPLLRGRDFTANDKHDSQRVAIVNEKLARRLWNTVDVVGNRITFDDAGKGMTIVGVTRNVRQNDFTSEPDSEIFIPYGQNGAARTSVAPSSATMTLVLRTRNDPMALASVVRAAVARIDKDIAVAQVRSADRIIDNILWQSRMTAAVTGLLASFALTLACIGLYGVLSYVVASKKRETGIRLALGATRTNVVLLFLRYGTTMVVSGIAIGLTVSFVVLRSLQSVMYGVKEADTNVLAAGPLVLLGVALVTALIPALRASRLNPVRALQGD